MASSWLLYGPIIYFLSKANWESFPDMDYLYFFYAGAFYLFSWLTLLGGIYLAGPEVVAKLQEFYNVIKKKIIKEK